MVSECPAADICVSGATTHTLGVIELTISSITLMPSAWMLSSFEIRIRASDSFSGKVNIRLGYLSGFQLRGGLQLFDAAHIGQQRIGDDHAAVRLLVILQNRNQAAAHSQTRTVQRMHIARLLVALGLVARHHAARLEITAVGA